MANVPNAYSELGDLLIGDIPLPQRHGDGTKMVQYAAKEIDGQIGHIYVTPISVEPGPQNRPTVLLLSKINNLIASGRLLLDMAAGDEDDQNHAYGMSLLREGINLLNAISSGKIDLTGVERLDDTEAPAGPYIQNEDPVSLVESFYRPYMNGEPVRSVRPYGDPKAVGL